VTYSSYLELHRLTAEALQCPEFGLKMSRVASAETLGLTGFTMMQASTVGEAWETLARIYRAHDTFGSVQFETAGELVVMSYRLPHVDLPGSRGVFDVAAGISTNIMLQLCGPDWHPAVLGFPYNQPADLSVYDHLRAGRLVFNAPCYQLFFGADWAGMPVSSSNPAMRAALDQYFGDYEAARGRSTKEQVEDLIRTLLPLGNCNLEQVASMLSISPRGLQLRLTREHTTFQQTLDFVRMEIALHHLVCGDLQLTQLAMILGYSELSAFSRSFRRQSGMSPRQYQRAHPLPG